MTFTSFGNRGLTGKWWTRGRRRWWWWWMGKENTVHYILLVFDCCWTQNRQQRGATTIVSQFWHRQTQKYFTSHILDILCTFMHMHTWYQDRYCTLNFNEGTSNNNNIYYIIKIYVLSLPTPQEFINVPFEGCKLQRSTGIKIHFEV